MIFMWFTIIFQRFSNKKEKIQNHCHCSKTIVEDRLRVIWPILKSLGDRKSNFIVWGWSNPPWIVRRLCRLFSLNPQHSTGDNTSCIGIPLAGDLKPRLLAGKLQSPPSKSAHPRQPTDRSSRVGPSCTDR
jgi:hypothetical protein